MDSPTNQIFPIFTEQQVEELRAGFAFDFIAPEDERPLGHPLLHLLGHPEGERGLPALRHQVADGGGNKNLK